MQNSLSRASAATLGYIVGNLPGAYLGYKMAPIRRGKRKMSIPGPFVRPNRNFKRRKYTRKRETGVTLQRDSVTQYAFKKMPRYKKRQWKKFSKKVLAVNEKALGTRTVLFNGFVTVTTPSTNQGVCVVGLYGFMGNGDTSQYSGMRDIYQICNNDGTLMAQGSTGTNPSKLTFKSAVLDLTMLNIGSVSSEVDVYEIFVNTDLTKTGNFIDSIIRAEAQTPSLTSPGVTGLSLGQRGVTLFDLPNLISSDNLKIYRKRKYLLAPGGAATLQHRDPRNVGFTPADFPDGIPIGDIKVSSYGRKRYTKLFVFVVKGITGAADSTTLRVGYTRKYSYVVEESARAGDSYNPPIL